LDAYCGGFFDAKRELQANLKSGAKPIINALVKTYRALVVHLLFIRKRINATEPTKFATDPAISSNSSLDCRPFAHVAN
jgi:hypothetical protein